jgi:hypothetical protein
MIDQETVWLGIALAKESTDDANAGAGPRQQKVTVVDAGMDAER